MAEEERPPVSAENTGDLNAATTNSEATGDHPVLQQFPNMTGILTSEDDERRKELLEAALGYARRGWKVVPVRWINSDGHCSCHQAGECLNPGKHPVPGSDWPNVATADPQEVAMWWRPEPQGLAQNWFPFANVGIVTGRDSGVFVLDEDTYAGGSQTLGAYERRNGAMPATRVHSTARGGSHYFFAHPGFDVRNSARKVLGKGLDVRGERGLVVAPPSRAPQGDYELNPAHDIDPVPAPGWLLDLLRNHDREQTGAVISGEMPSEATGAARKYAEAALKAESARMAECEEGSRNDTLNSCAYSLGTLGGAGLLSEDAAWEALRAAALAAGLADGEIRGTFLSGWRSGLDNPRNVQWQAMATDWPVRPRTEFGLADRMADHFGDQLRYCPETDGWMAYRNGVWVAASKRAGEWAAQMMIRRLPYTEANSYDDATEVAPDGTELPSLRDNFLDWVGKQQTRKAVSAASNLGAALPLMQMSQHTFDSEPLLANTRNGVVDLSTGELHSHDPEQRMTLQCAASYYPGEPAPKFQAFLRQVQPDPEMRGYLQRVAGYIATGLTTEQAFFLLHGRGANGKSVWQGVVAAVLGTYAQTMPVETLTASAIDGRVPNDVARMAGKRFLQTSETKAGKALDEQKLKQLTGGDSVTARYMRGEWFDFRPVGKLMLTTNHLPRLSDDSATWRRIHLIPWPVIIDEDKRDGYLQDTLIREESNGILAWIIEGALAWHEEGLSPPRVVKEALAQYQQEEDIVAQFVTECLDVVPPVRGVIGRDVSTIWHAWAEWARREGHPVTGQRWLTTRLKKVYEYDRAGGWAGFPCLTVKLPGIGGAEES